MNVSNNVKQLILYLIVGGIATIVEWAMFYLLDSIGSINYALATTIAFAVSTFANWAAGRLILFKGTGHLFAELAKIYMTSIAGLFMNLLIMWIAIDVIGIPNFLSKVIATGIVFFWNFIIRKLLIYRSDCHDEET